MNVQHIIIEVREEIRLRQFGHLKGMESNKISKLILKLNSEGRRRKKKPMEQQMDRWMDGKEDT